MRLLGDEYIKKEFRDHRDVENPVHIVSSRSSIIVWLYLSVSRVVMHFFMSFGISIVICPIDSASEMGCADRSRLRS